MFGAAEFGGLDINDFRMYSSLEFDRNAKSNLWLALRNQGTGICEFTSALGRSLEEAGWLDLGGHASYFSEFWGDGAPLFAGRLRELADRIEERSESGASDE